MNVKLNEVQHLRVQHIGLRIRNKIMSWGNKVQKVNEEKYLGVTVSSNFKVSNQCIEAAKKGSHILGLRKITITSREKEVILRVYKSLVRPVAVHSWKLEYCVQTGMETSLGQRY